MPFDDPNLCQQFTEMHMTIVAMHNKLIEHIEEEDQLTAKVDDLLTAWNKATGIVWFIKWTAIIITGLTTFLATLKHLGLLKL
jgi:hypothetical protein